MVPRLWLDNYTAAINELSRKSRDSLTAALALIDLMGDVAEVRAQVVALMNGVCGAATSGTAQLSRAFYNAIRQQELGSIITGTLDCGRDPQATDGAVRAFADKLVKGDPQSFVNLCVSRVDYEIKVAAAQTCLNNAKVDPVKPRFARVPTGDETCDFCLMLASRGFVYHTEASASHAHAHCDCRVTPSWKAHEVEGYDPDALAVAWVDAVEEKAAKRAARNGTDVDTERQNIMDAYARSAKNARLKAKLRKAKR
jgi:hypothetical protein